jgi:hypothetical protein
MGIRDLKTSGRHFEDAIVERGVLLAVFPNDLVNQAVLLCLLS